jgi:hypothetical protein
MKMRDSAHLGRPIASLGIEHPPNTSNLPSGVSVIVWPYLGVGIKPTKRSSDEMWISDLRLICHHSNALPGRCRRQPTQYLLVLEQQ